MLKLVPSQKKLELRFHIQLPSCLKKCCQSPQENLMSQRSLRPLGVAHTTQAMLSVSMLATFEEERGDLEGLMLISVE